MSKIDATDLILTSQVLTLQRAHNIGTLISLFLHQGRVVNNARPQSLDPSPLVRLANFGPFRVGVIKYSNLPTYQIHSAQYEWNNIGGS